MIPQLLQPALPFHDPDEWRCVDCGAVLTEAATHTAGSGLHPVHKQGPGQWRCDTCYTALYGPTTGDSGATGINTQGQPLAGFVARQTEHTGHDREVA